MKYETGKGYKMAEEDDYDEGCLLGTASSSTIDVEFSHKTIDGLIGKMAEYFGVECSGINNAFQLDSCDEPGRIDIQLMEDGDGNQATPEDFKLFKQHKRRLWSVTYTYNVVRVSRTTVNLVNEIRYSGADK